jgi:hypothetical protein
VKTLESKETRAQRKKTVTHNSVFAAHRLKMPDAIPKSTSGIFLLLLAIKDRQSKFGNSLAGA